jgi:Dna[CI] antecedent DciA-like protein
MLKLGSVLDTWRPKPGPGSDPLVAVRAAWVELVGGDVARAAQPVAIERDALVVLTASSAWSHQLAFLEPEIVRGLRSLPETQALTRLRFRVGKLRRPIPVRDGPGGPRRASSAVGAEPPAKTLDDALARLRRSVDRTRAAHHARGGAFCALCDASIDAGASMCRPCRDDDARRRRYACERLMFEAPWLGSEKVLALVGGLTAETYDATRRQLLQSWWDELWRAHKLHKLRQPLDRVRLRKLASSFVLLHTQIDPNRLEMDSAVRKNALGELYDFVRSIETTQ